VKWSLLSSFLRLLARRIGRSRLISSCRVLKAFRGLRPVRRIETYINCSSTDRQVPCTPPIMLSLTSAAPVGERAFRSARKAIKKRKLSIYRRVSMAIIGISYMPCDNKYLKGQKHGNGHELASVPQADKAWRHQLMQPCRQQHMAILGRDLQRRAANTSLTTDLRYMHAMKGRDGEEWRPRVGHTSTLTFCRLAEVVGTASHQASFHGLRLCKTATAKPMLILSSKSDP
jgi:hypothetical protein